MRRRDIVSIGTLVAGLALPALLAIGLPQPGRAVVALAIVCVIPGFALVRLADLADGAALAVFSVAVSLAVSAIVSTALLYLTAWSLARCVYVLGALTVLASLMRLGREK